MHNYRQESSKKVLNFIQSKKNKTFLKVFGQVLIKYSFVCVRIRGKKY